MAIDTKDQYSLHQARQTQLNRSSVYIKNFIIQADLEQGYDKSPCPTCHQSASHTLFSKNNGHYCFCPSCEHIYLSNPLKQEQLIKFYTGYPVSSLDWHHNESDFYKQIYQKGLNMIKPSCQGINLLDIGCSGGFFLSIASKQGFRASGIEPNKEESAYAIENGINVIGSIISDLDSSSKFDVITLWDVLEHIREPVNYLKNLRSHLNTNGLVFVQIPTSDSLAARVMRDACNMFDGIEHLTLFSARSLDIAFKKARYSHVNSQSVISEIHTLRNYLGYEPDPYLANPEMPFHAEFLSAEKIESSRLGYKIQAVYRIE
jgi:2-polyprenyl-3-methyl-5-hydroxy-6-metoxy-1,4-benzoquinol methylase